MPRKPSLENRVDTKRHQGWDALMAYIARNPAAAEFLTPEEQSQKAVLDAIATARHSVKTAQDKLDHVVAKAAKLSELIAHDDSSLLNAAKISHWNIADLQFAGVDKLTLTHLRNWRVTLINSNEAAERLGITRYAFDKLVNETNTRPDHTKQVRFYGEKTMSLWHDKTIDLFKKDL
jgi:hypothetical protein